MNSKVRVRFAPSPTGALHIGGVRTALYNYLFAKKFNGTFILRIEDTDQTRYVPKASQYIIDSLNWCNIPFDEGPYYQSERKHLYNKYANQLIAKGKAYYAFDTSKDLEAHRKQHQKEGKTFIYNWHNREKGRLINSLILPKEEVKKRIDSGEKYVIRFKSPQNETLILEDEIRGIIKINTNTLDDKVLFKSDGMPTYHLANVVDDYLMKISHVIRGEEWLPSLPFHVLLYRAFDWKPPKFAHLPLILNPDGKGKLSKRDADKLGFPVFPLAYTNPQTGHISSGYKEDGYFNDAFINMLSLLGWNPGTEQEIFSLEELIKAFSLSRVSKSPAKFNPEKTKWFNQQYLQKKENSELTCSFSAILKNKKIDADISFVEKVVSLIKERAVFLSDFWDLGNFFFESPVNYDEKALKKHWKENTSILLKEATDVILSIDDFSTKNIETILVIHFLIKEIGLGKVLQPLRLALVGALKGPNLFDIIEIIGKDETVFRVHRINGRSIVN